MKKRVRASVICLSEGKMLMVRQEDPGSGKRYLFPPGGKIEKGEAPMLAAERETLEETGYRVKAIASSERVLSYHFNWGGKVIDVTTHFFMATLVDREGDPVGDECLEVLWVPVTRAVKEFAYHPDLAAVVAEILSVAH